MNDTLKGIENLQGKQVSKNIVIITWMKSGYHPATDYQTF